VVKVKFFLLLSPKPILSQSKDNSMNNIKNIILDLGGVLINLDYHKTNDKLGKLGVPNGFTKAKQITIFDDLEEGKISDISFYEAINKLAGSNHSPQLIIDAWNAILLDFPKKRLDLVQQLNEHYRVFLFSNTNAIHFREVHKNLQEVHGIPNLEAHFEKVYLSHELGIRKPKLEGFQHILDMHQLNPTETLFVDDSPQHIQGALKVGIKAEWLNLEKEDIHGLLNRLKLI
jgi:glucose-1-phosphatase